MRFSSPIPLGRRPLTGVPQNCPERTGSLRDIEVRRYPIHHGVRHLCACQQEPATQCDTYILCRIAWIIYDRGALSRCALERMYLPSHAHSSDGAREAQKHSVTFCLYPEASDDGHHAPGGIAHPHLHTIPEGEIVIQRGMRAELQCVVIVEADSVDSGGLLVLLNQ